MKDVTLLFLLRSDEILLAMKKRGFGAGKWNGVGGKVAPGESIEAATIRECQEEIGVTPHHITRLGEIEFLMSHDPTFGHRAHIFSTTEWEGTPLETEEMRPKWFKHPAIPYDTMWADDILWLPYLLKGAAFKGKVILGPEDRVEQSEITKIG